jgi:hypothetical protein
MHKEQKGEKNVGGRVVWACGREGGEGRMGAEMIRTEEMAK